MNIKEFFVKNWLQKLISLLFAVGLFFYVGNMKTSERLINIPLKIKNQPGYLMPLKKLPTRVTVKISGLMRKIVLIEARQITASVDLGAAVRGVNTLFVNLSYSGISEGIALQSSVKTIKVTMDMVIQKMLPIRVRLKNRPAPGFEVKKYTAEPATIILEGPRLILNKMKYIETQTINISGIKTSMDRIVGLNFQRENIHIKYPTKILCSIKVGQEMIVRELKGIIVTIKPSTAGLISKETNGFFVSIRCSGSKEMLSSLSNSDFTALVDASTVVKAGKKVLPVQITTKKPVRIERIIPDKILFDFQKEKP